MAKTQFADLYDGNKADAALRQRQKGLQDSPPLTLPLDGFTTWNGVKAFLPFSRETARKRELAGQFPRRHRLTQRCTVYSNRELHRWFADPLNYRAGC